MTASTSTSSNNDNKPLPKTNSSPNNGEEEEPFLVSLLKNIFLSATTYVVVKVLRDYFAKRQQASRLTRSSESSASQQQRLSNLLSAKKLSLNYYEEIISQDVIDPENIDVTFHDIGGMEDMKNELYDLVVLPLLRPDLFVTTKKGLVSFPRGILLYGSPGTGKTMMAKAIAKEGHATFLNVRLSSIFDKYFGESNKLIAAIFSLSKKLAPSVIFIDEIDSFLTQRGDSGGNDSSAISSIRSEFLTLWDGINTSDSNDVDDPVMVLGATNRPYDVDEAILRRLPRTFEIDLPNENSRLHILELILKDQEMTIKARELLPSIASMTDDYSGSDLKELCRCAAMEPIREYTSNLRSRTKITATTTTSSSSLEDAFLLAKQTNIRKINEHDFANALKKVKRTGESAANFQQKTYNKNKKSHGNINNMEDIIRGIQLLQKLMGTNAASAGMNGNTENGDEDEIFYDGDEDMKIPEMD